MKSHAAQVGTSVVIDLGGDHSITLQDVLLKNLSAGDFPSPNTSLNGSETASRHAFGGRFPSLSV